MRSFVFVAAALAVSIGATAARADGTARVQVRSADAVRLESRAGRGEPWEDACAAPCNAELPVDREYRVAGEGVRSSRVFTLDARAGDQVVVEAHASTTSAMVTGIVLTSVGGVALLGGLFAAFTEGALAGDEPAGGQEHTAANAFLIVGVVGAVVTLVGVLTLTSNVRSSVTVQHFTPRPSPFTAPPPREGARTAPTMLPLFYARF